MQRDLSSPRSPLWLRLLHHAMLPGARSPHGWLSDEGHWHRRPGRYCELPCRVCKVQKLIDTYPLPATRHTTPLS